MQIRKRTRICSAILLLAMITANSPAHAAEMESSQSVARIENTDYSTIADAVASAGNNDTITLLQDTKYESETSLSINNKNITLDLNGKTLTVKMTADNSGKTWDNADYGISVAEGSLTIKDTGNGNGIIDFSNARFGISLEQNSKFILQGGELKNCSGRGLQDSIIRARDHDTEILIEDGRIEGQVSTKSSKTASFTMTGGELAAWNEAALFLQGKGKISITSGEIRFSPNYSGERTATALVYIATSGTQSSRQHTEITGGTIEAVNNVVPLYINSYKYGDMVLGGGSDMLKIIAENAPAVQLPSSSVAKQAFTLKIKKDAILVGATYAIEFIKENKYDTISIEKGAYLGYQTIPINNSRYVIYPEGYVLNTQPTKKEEKIDLYTLIEKEKLSGKNEQTGEEYTYQNFDGNGIDGGGLNQLLTQASDIYDAGNEQDTYPAEVWSSFRAAYENAQDVKTNANANQVEIDYRAEQLTYAMQSLDSAAAIDPNSLANGEYTVDISLYKYNMSGPSMAAGAVKDKAKLIVGDNGMQLKVDFKPLYQMTLWGHMLNLWVADGDTPEGAKENWDNHPYAESTDKSYWTEATKSNYYKAEGADMTYNPDAAAGETEEYPYPGTVTIDLPYVGKNNESTLYCRVAVDAMQQIAAPGTSGNQNVLLLIQYSTLEADLETIQPTLRVSEDEAYLAVNNDNYKTAEVGYTLAGAERYSVAASVSGGQDAVVSATVDDEENKIELQAQKKGTGTVTVTATPPSGATDAKPIEKTIQVTVGDGEAVKVENVSVLEGTAATSVTGGALLPDVENTGLEIQTDSVTINAESAEDGDSVKAAEVKISQTAAEALSSKTAATILTDVGDVKLDQAMLKQIAEKIEGATLRVESAENSSVAGVSPLAVYEVTLKAGDEDIAQGNGTVTVTAPVGGGSTVKTVYAYLVAEDGLREEQTADYNSSDKTVGWSVTQSGTWVLTARKYDSGSGGGSTGGGIVQEEIEPASESEFTALGEALNSAKTRLGDEADGNAIISAAEAALDAREIGSEAVTTMIAALDALKPVGQAVQPDASGLKSLYQLANDTVTNHAGLYASVEGLQTAANSVANTVNNSNATAEEIESASKTLRTAFAELVRTAAEAEGVDVNNLTEGTYQVPITVKQFASPSQDSMANNAVDDYATINVAADGTKTMTLTFNPMYLDLNGGQWGHLLCGWIYQGSTPEEAKSNVTNGSNYTKMTLTDYYTSDANGTKIPMTENPAVPDDSSQWPGTVAFTMPYIGTGTDYNKLYIRVAVDAMGGYNTEDDNSHEQSAIVVVDYTQIRRLDDSGNPVDPGVLRTALRNTISEAEGELGNPDKFSAASAANAQVALTNAYAVCYKENAEQSEIDKAASDLQKAIDGLTVATTVIQIDRDYLTDTLNAGVFVEAYSGAVAQDVTLRASYADTSSAALVLSKLAAQGVSDSIVYSISLLGESGQAMQPDDTVTVKIKIPDGWDEEKLTVYHFANLYNAKPQEITGGRVENGFFVFETDSFSYFALAEKLSSSGGVEDPDDGNYEAGTVEFTAGSHGSLTATVDGKTISSGDTVEGGKTVVFTADPNSGYRVDEWSGDVSGSATTKRVTVDGDVYVHVSFRESSSLEWDEELEEEEGISNGIYSVPVRVKKAATPSEDSMANNAVSQYAKARVTSSGVTYTLTFKGMSLNGLYGHLLDMWYYDPDDDDLTNPIPCDVDATYTDTDLDGDRSTFPREVSFTVDGDPLDEIYIRVNVDAMNTVGAGEQDAILRVYWDDAEKDGGDAAEEEAEELENEAEDVEISSGSTFSASRLDTLIENGGELIVSNDDASVRFSEAALLEIDDQAGSSSIKVSIAETAASSMSEAQAEKAGNRPAYTIEVAAGSKAVTGFGANATVTLPYALQDNETANGLAVWMIDEDGTLTVLDCTYNSTKETVAFSTDRAGVFVIAYSAENAWINPFTDVASNNWYFEAVRYVSVNGLFNGTSETAFSPDSAMTRAMLWTVLARYDGQDTSGGSNWYEAARNWAMTESISDGTNPDGNITREQLAAILYRYAGEPSADGGTLDQFTDRTNISSYATEAMQWATEQGIVNGKSNSTLDPQGNATRAEVATMMMRFAEKYPNQ